MKGVWRRVLIGACLSVFGLGCWNNHPEQEKGALLAEKPSKSASQNAGAPVKNPGTASNKPWTSSAGANRESIRATSLMTVYEYGEGVSAAIGIPTGAKVFRTQGEEAVGEPVLVASGGELVDERVGEEEMRVIRLNFLFHDLDGEEVARMVAFFRPFAMDAYIVKTILDDRYESVYAWGDIPGHSLVRITIRDLQSGEKVAETDTLEFIEGSQGLFRGIERHFAGDETTCISAFVRHAGTGLLVDERILEGTSSADYHPYEFVLAGWPSGASPGFGGGIGF